MPHKNETAAVRDTYDAHTRHRLVKIKFALE